MIDHRTKAIGLLQEAAKEMDLTDCMEFKTWAASIRSKIRALDKPVEHAEQCADRNARRWQGRVS